MGARILVVASDAGLRASLARSLSAAGYAVEVAEGAKRAREVLARRDIALTVLSSECLGNADLEPARQAAASKLIVIAERGDEIPRLAESTAAAHAYIARPLNEGDVLAQIEAALQPNGSESAPPRSEVLRFSGLTIDVRGHAAFDAGGREVPLTRAEFALLLVFARHPGRALSRDQLLDLATGRRRDPYDRSIDVMVSRLRRKIEPDPKKPSVILTLAGVGYKFAARPEPEPAAGEPIVDPPRVAADQPRRRWADRLGRPIAALGLIAAVLAVFAGVVGLSLSHPRSERPSALARPADRHWVNGTWAAILTPTPISDPNFCAETDGRCRKFVIANVGGDGDFTGAWGYQGESPAPARVTVSGNSLRVVTSTDSVVEARLGANGMLSGTLTAPAQVLAPGVMTGMPIIFRKIKPAADTDPARQHWINGRWVGMLTREPVLDPNFCDRPDIHCRILDVANAEADGEFLGSFAYQGEGPIPVGVSVSDQSVRILMPGQSYIEAHRDADGRLSGMLMMQRAPFSTKSRDANAITFAVTLRKVK